MTEGIFTVILALVGVAVGAGIVWLLIGRKKTDKKDDQSFLIMQNDIQDLRRTVLEQLGQSSKEMQESVRYQFKESSDLSQRISKEVNEQLREVVKNVAEVGESSKQVFQVADQLKELQNILKNPKQRGILGEYYLETVLNNVLPPGAFQMQYSFSDGEIVDAAVFVKDKVIPVDSKFSLENYNRYIESADGPEKTKFEKAFVNDLKIRITETSKYVRPAEKTTEFAFMFIPHEGIYYDLLSNKVGAAEENLIQRAAGKYKVIIVSPTSFLAYLQTVLQGLRALEIEEKAQDIIKNVEKLSGHIERYDEYYLKLGRTLSTTINHYNDGYKELAKIDKDILKITDSSPGLEKLELERPKLDE